jgi:4-hydroxy-tetrahydrodipicolinate synthase
MAIRKEVLHRRGALASPATRAPGAQLDRTTREALDRVMAWVERAGSGLSASGARM